MNLQTIKSMNGQVEYILLPITLYNNLRQEIKTQIEKMPEYELFNAADYIDNPIALARIEAGLTQEELAKIMQVTQAYISKIEKQKKVTTKLLLKVEKALKTKK